MSAENLKMIVESDVSGLAYGDDLTNTVQIDVERLLEKAPSDSTLLVHISRVGDQFKVALALASEGLQFVLNSTARSPFVASEKALNLAWDKVRVWSAGKRF